MIDSALLNDSYEIGRKCEEFNLTHCFTSGQIVFYYHEYEYILINFCIAMSIEGI